MLRLSASLLNRPVMSLRSGGPLAMAQKPIINPHNLKIVGWWCRGAGSSKLVLLAEDVREIMPTGLAVNDEAALSSTEDLVRHRDILDINFELADKPVRTKRQKLGRISDYSYSDDMFVQKLYVSRPLVKIFSSDDTLIIDRNQVLEVTDKHILVKDTEVKVSKEEFSGAFEAAAS